MTSRRTLIRVPGALTRVLVGAFLLATSLLLPRVVAAVDWVAYVDETGTRISSDASVGVDDVREKDLISGDIDQDGDTDLIVVRKIPFTNPGGFRNVLFMNEGGVMVDRTATLAPDFLDATDDREVELADVNGDTWLDVITAGTFEEQPRILINRGESGGIWRGLQHQSIRLPILTSPTGAGPKFCGLAVGDVTGNGRPDLYFTDYENDMEDRLLINNGLGFFTDETASRTIPAMVESTFGSDADMGDMNGDGFLDIIKNDASGSAAVERGAGDQRGTGVNPAVSILYNDGTGHFTSWDNIYTQAPYMIAPADFTQDGRLDLFVVDDGQDSYLINTGNDGSGHAQFSSSPVQTSPNTSFFGGNVKFADLDNDGVLDVLVADVDTDLPPCNNRQLVLLQGQGTPPAVSYADPLSGASRPWTQRGTFDVEAMHINDDGVLDLWIGHCTGTKIFMGVSRDIFLDGFESGDSSAWTSTVP